MKINDMRQAISRELEYIWLNEQAFIETLNPDHNLTINQVLFSSDFISFEIYHKDEYSEHLPMSYEEYDNFKRMLEAKQ